ncbi:MAG: exo-beta-N-acetylmuramidase NamZ domain-containing protein [Actinomycetota bacterium]
MKKITIPVLLVALALTACSSGSRGTRIMTGADRTGEYLPLLQAKRVAVVANQTSMTGKTHLVDTLLSSGIDVKLIFAPEHGFRDLADAGAVITSGADPVTGIEVISLYSSKKKPAPEDLAGVDVVIFDIQDVGTRFYTYLTTMCYVMEACAESGKPFILLDRPNPNGYYVDGPLLDTSGYTSFVGIHPIPVVHGMTFGEYAGMVNGEGWLAGGIQCALKVIECSNYTHGTMYQLPVIPSPNLPNMNSVYLYPSLCFAEGTVLSCGRGTDFAFQVLGAPEIPDTGFSFTPMPSFGSANPKHNGIACFGIDLRNALKDGLVPKPEMNLGWIIGMYNAYPDKEKFFNGYFDTLAGSSTLREQIISGMSAEAIRETWKEGLDKFRLTRTKYLLYQ